MRTTAFIAITLIAGAIAGTILGVLNQIAVEPFIEHAIELETQTTAQSSQIINPSEFAAYRSWQSIGEIVAGTILGLSIGSLFGIVFAYARSFVPGSNNKEKALIVASILWLVLFFIPAFKYPANPPGIGHPETIYYRQMLYIIFIAISGFTALGLAFVYKNNGAWRLKKIIIPVIYAAIMAAAFLVMPPNPDTIDAPMDLVINFRIMSAVTITVFWGLLGLIFGALWDTLNPHKSARISIS